MSCSLVAGVPAVISCKIENAKELQIKQPFDSDFERFVLSVAERSSASIPGFRFGYFDNHDIFFISIPDKETVSTGPQRLVSMIASQLCSEMFYQRLNVYNPKYIFSVSVEQTVDPASIISRLVSRCKKNSMISFVRSNTPASQAPEWGSLSDDDLSERLRSLSALGLDWNHMPSSRQHGTFFYPRDGHITKNNWCRLSIPPDNKELCQFVAGLV